ncbi:MAG TPA: methyltransferase [Spongiibacteraceae bacterium]|nr:methyltransferase [Spongiibacteraceae bacterium]
MRSMQSALVSILLSITAAPTLNAANNPAAVDQSLQTVLAGSWRSDDNRARDRFRHPAETLTFLKVGSRDTVIEITPGAGWYAEILAPLLQAQGHYIAAVAAPDSVAPEQREYQLKNRDKLADKFAADKVRFGAAKIVEFDTQAPVLGAPNSADVVLTFRNVHNWVANRTEAAYFKAFYAVLKPGGILGVEDHRAPQGAALNTESGYLPEDMVIKLATDAGFKLDAKSEINANPKDTKDYPKGVWTLPPTLRLGEQDKEKYLAIGESDRFTLRFVKPGK